MPLPIRWLGYELLCFTVLKPLFLEWTGTDNPSLPFRPYLAIPRNAVSETLKHKRTRPNQKLGLFPFQPEVGHPLLWPGSV